MMLRHFDQLSMTFNKLGKSSALLPELRSASMQVGTFVDVAIWEAVHAELARIENPPGQPENQLIDGSRIRLTTEGIALARMAALG
jgi:hypothetical protein